MHYCFYSKPTANNQKAPKASEPRALLQHIQRKTIERVHIHKASVEGLTADAALGAMARQL